MRNSDEKKTAATSNTRQLSVPRNGPTPTCTENFAFGERRFTIETIGPNTDENARYPRIRYTKKIVLSVEELKLFFCLLVCRALAAEGAVFRKFNLSLHLLFVLTGPVVDVFAL